MEKLIVVLSGGMDSTTALAKTLYELGPGSVVSALSFWYGSKHNEREWESAQKVARYYGVPVTRIKLDFILEHFKSDLLKSGGQIPLGHYADPSMKKTVVPFRNGIMLAIATGFAESNGATGLVLGNHFGDHAIYPDCRVSFIEPMAKAMEEGTYQRIQLFSPFSTLTKTDIAKLGHKLNVPYHLTYSCYQGREKHCGECGTCFERREAFREADVLDPTEYE